MEIIDVIIATIERIGFIITIIKFIRKWKKQSVCMGLVVFAIVMGGLWYRGYSTNVLLGFAMGIVFCVGGIILVAQIYHNKQLTKQLKQKDRENQIHQKIIEEGEQRLFEKTQEISKEWIEQWDEGVKQWERNVLGIKNPKAGIKVSGNRPSLVKAICAHGERELCLLYEKALKEDLTEKHYEKICGRLNETFFEEYYVKAVQLMEENGISLQKFVNPVTNQEQYKPTMLLLHWFLYVLDDMITAEYEQYQKDKALGRYKNIVSLEIYFEDIPKYTEYETLGKVLEGFGCRPSEWKRLCICKKVLLSFLYDVSSDYKAARKTFIYYKMLIDTVKEGYIAFDEDCRYSTVEGAMKVCRKKDKEEKKDLSISDEMPTFEEAYKLGAKEWMKGASKRCDDRLIFWEELITIGNSKEKLKIIFGDKKVQALREAVDKEQERFENEIQSAILANKYLTDNKSYAYLAGILGYNG
ncbi:hypothetical protein MCU_01328 [Bartonella elizabethae Re6043vi]|uniref:Uncharacterized protein n=2 Tax=Bartonella elizabethae TaxID=807 RepID=J0REX6_BAREL|nr:hypothetical protein [Bartonella elizabethae]EJF82733.1 hypothetical protein MCU_01328 [Bartonella elizabethae Re6043vi]EJF97376.1 hypothetical protein MEE_00004 [Bartonella elizabethae F9251 = ATCC 49927]VEJ41978.1 Uncharacterised protein [Bartonella elizabethae]